MNTEPRYVYAIFCGSRNWTDADRIRSVMSSLDPASTLIVTGGAHGADMLADQIARELGFDTEVYPADWDRHGKAAGMIRNKQMAKVLQTYATARDSQRVYAFGTSGPGTSMMVQLAHDNGFRVFTYN